MLNKKYIYIDIVVRSNLFWFPRVLKKLFLFVRMPRNSVSKKLIWSYLKKTWTLQCEKVWTGTTVILAKPLPMSYTDVSLFTSKNIITTLTKIALDTWHDNIFCTRVTPDKKWTVWNFLYTIEVEASRYFRFVIGSANIMP